MESEQQDTHNRRYVLAVLIAAVTFAEISKDCLWSWAHGDWSDFWGLVHYGTIACLPFLLARMVPKAASFRLQWLPRLRRHWIWFLGMLILAIGVSVLVCPVAACAEGYTWPPQLIAIVFPATLDLEQVLLYILIGPIAEEIFYRAYVLGQLRKVTHWSIAIFIQSVDFAFAHLYFYAKYSSDAILAVAGAFAFALIAGAWRIKFKSLLPLVLAHSFLNIFIMCNKPDWGTSDEAFSGYNEAIRRDPSDPLRYWRRGAAYYRIGKYDEATTDFSEAIRLDPTLAAWYCHRGLANARKGDYKDAISDFSEAIRLEPGRRDACMGRGNAYVANCQYDKAVEDFDRAIHVDSNDAEAFFYRGSAYFKKRAYDRAIADFGSAIALDSKDGEAYYRRAKSYEAKGDKAKAEEDFAHAAKLGYKP
jgi:tetratricopeptide (TPR) repeat protein